MGMMPDLLLPLNVFHYRRIGLDKGPVTFQHRPDHLELLMSMTAFFLPSFLSQL
jgi:hypothetical protein